MRLHSTDRRTQILQAQPDLAQTIKGAIGIDSQVLPHLTIKGWRGRESEAMLDFLLSKYPELLEARSPERGFTPLLCAV